MIKEKIEKWENVNTVRDNNCKLWVRQKAPEYQSHKNSN